MFFPQRLAENADLTQTFIILYYVFFPQIHADICDAINRGDSLSGVCAEVQDVDGVYAQRILVSYRLRRAGGNNENAKSKNLLYALQKAR